MSIYIITGKVQADTLETPFGTWHGTIDIPVFKVDTDSRSAALQLAREIIDPLEITEVYATAVEEVTSDRSVIHAQLEAGLRALFTGAVLTPYEHYCEAERLLAEVEHQGSYGQNTLSRAQIHATLATAVIPGPKEEEEDSRERPRA